MARGPRIKLTKYDLYNNITPKERDLVAKTMIDILKGKRPNTSNRDLVSAAKNLILMNNADIDLAKNEDPTPDQMVIRIEEIDYSPLVEQEKQEEKKEEINE